MSSSEELWDQLAQRVARSQVAGVSAEDDDVLAAADIIEALINPHRGAQAAGAGTGGPGMMPPMMMGGAGGSSGGGGGGGARPAEGAVGPMASAGAQGAAPAGIPGMAREVDRPPAAPGGFAGGNASGGTPLPGGASASGSGATEDVPATEPEDEPTSEISSAQGSAVIGVGMQKPESRPGPEDMAGWNAPVHAQDGFSVDPTLVHSLAERWAELAKGIDAVPNHPEASMGLFEQAQRPHQALIQQLNAWRQGASKEFDAVAARLHETAAHYASVDDDGVAEVRRTEGLAP